MQYLANLSLHTDEAAIALNLRDRSLGGLLSAPLDYAQMAPPAWLALEWVVLRTVGGTEYALRLIPLLASLSSLVLLAALSLQPQSTARISGSVTDETALPLPGAVIELNGRVVATSDERGAFEFVAAVDALSRIRIALDGFEPYEALLDNGDARLDVVLAVRRFEDRVRVTARPPRPPVDPVFMRQPIDVYRTPGAQGDLFLALQTLPGVIAADDAAGLFVRGGDVSEVIVSLDDAVTALRFERAGH